MYISGWGMLAVPVCFLLYWLSDRMPFWPALGMAVLSGFGVTFLETMLDCARAVGRSLTAGQIRVAGFFALCGAFSVLVAPVVWGLLLLYIRGRWGWAIAFAIAVPGYGLAYVLGMFGAAAIARRRQLLEGAQ